MGFYCQVRQDWIPNKQPFVVVIGLHSSGSSCCAGVLHHLGLHMGNNLVGYHGFEPATLARFLETALPLPNVQWNRSEEELRRFLGMFIFQKQCEALQKGTLAGIKHPLLCQAGELLHDICGDNLRVVHINRPISLSITSLQKREKKYDSEKIAEHQRWLETGKQSLLQTANHVLHLEYSNLVNNPPTEIERICKFLKINPADARREAAIASINPEKMHIMGNQTERELTSSKSSLLEALCFPIGEERYLFTDLFIDDDYRLIFMSMVYGDVDIKHEEVDCILPDGQVCRFMVDANYWHYETAVACLIDNQGLRDFLAKTPSPVDIQIRYKGETRRFQLPKPLSSQHHTLSLFTLFKDDHYLLSNWLQHYRKLGVEHFYLYYNGSSDELASIAFEAPDVTFCAWNYAYLVHYETIRCESLKYNTMQAQMMAMNSCLYRVRQRTTWLAFFDLDEYLVVDDLRSLLSTYHEPKTSYVSFLNRWAHAPDFDFCVNDLESLYHSELLCNRQCTKWPVSAKMAVNTKNVSLAKIHMVKDHAELNGARVQHSGRFFLHFAKSPGKDRTHEIIDPIPFHLSSLS